MINPIVRSATVYKGWSFDMEFEHGRIFFTCLGNKVHMAGTRPALAALCDGKISIRRAERHVAQPAQQFAKGDTITVRFGEKEPPVAVEVIVDNVMISGLIGIFEAAAAEQVKIAPVVNGEKIPIPTKVRKRTFYLD